MLTDDEIYDLRNSVSEKVLVILSSATGITIEELKGRDFNSKYKQWAKEYEEMQVKKDSEIIES